MKVMIIVWKEGSPLFALSFYIGSSRRYDLVTNISFFPGEFPSMIGCSSC